MPPYSARLTGVLYTVPSHAAGAEPRHSAGTPSPTLGTPRFGSSGRPRPTPAGRACALGLTALLAPREAVVGGEGGHPLGVGLPRWIGHITPGQMRPHGCSRRRFPQQPGVTSLLPGSTTPCKPQLPGRTGCCRDQGDERLRRTSVLLRATWRSGGDRTGAAVPWRDQVDSRKGLPASGDNLGGR